jgi:hypothetical protein
MALQITKAAVAQLEAKIEGGKLHIVLPLHAEPMLTAGGNMALASSGGNRDSGIRIDGCSLLIGVNAYWRPKRQAPTSK